MIESSKLRSKRSENGAGCLFAGGQKMLAKPKLEIKQIFSDVGIFHSDSAFHGKVLGKFINPVCTFSTGLFTKFV